METVLVQINNSKVHQLLADLEDLQPITALKKIRDPKIKLSDKYAGQLPLSVAQELDDYVSKGRADWDNH